MNRSLATIVLPWLIFCCVAPVRAAELTVEAYGDLSLAHIELIAASWEESGRAPSPADEDALFERHGTTREEYYAFAGDHREEIMGYLDANPEIRKAIDELSARVRRLIEREETE